MVAPDEGLADNVPKSLLLPSEFRERLFMPPESTEV